MESDLPSRLFLPTVTVANQPDQTNRLRAEGQALMERAIDPTMTDDRFDGPASAPMIAATITDGDQPVVWLGGELGANQRVLDVDAIVDGDHLSGQTAATMLEKTYIALLEVIRSDAPWVKRINLWAKPERSWHQALADSQQLTDYRQLFQMRCQLPLDVSPIATEPYRPGTDEKELIEVNNRAFANHPDQGTLDHAKVESLMSQEWFDPEGLRLYRDPDNNRLVGFCWTKIHDRQDHYIQGRYTQEPIGEIFVIGIDPSYHGQGFGKPMTASGLDWMANQGITTAMLYVEADNVPALSTYRKLGFETHRIDRAWTAVVQRRPQTKPMGDKEH